MLYKIGENMSLLSEIKKDQLQSRKDKNTAVISILTTLIGEAAMAGKNDGNRESTDLEVVVVIKKFIKNGNELATAVGDGNAGYLEAMTEIAILESYLPSQLSVDEISDIVSKQISTLEEVSPKSMGKIMSHLKNNYAGKYDGRLASKIVKEALNG